MKIWAVSDTHGNHSSLVVPPDVDCLIFAGDATNYRNIFQNEVEFYDFKQWLFDLPIKHKILIAGNHDTWATKKYNIDDLKYNNVVYLEHEYFELDDLTIFGSPYTPVFNDWNFMVKKDKISRYWDDLNENIDILVTHGPPKGILDLSHNHEEVLERCGDSALQKKVDKIKPLFHIFGHIHDSPGCFNQGMLQRSGVHYMNVSCVTDGKLNQLSSHGLVINI